MNNTDRTKATFIHRGTLCHLLASSYASFFALTSSSAFLTSSSIGIASSSSPLVLIVSSKYFVADNKAASCTNAVSAAAKVAAVSAHGYSSMSFSSRGAKYVNDAIINVGTIIKRTGSVPARIGSSGNCIMPHRTEVGQSGPPTKMETLSIGRPGCASISFVARMNRELIPTCCLTYTEFDRLWPINFCWREQASNFNTKERAIAYTIDQTRPRLSRPMATMTIPIDK
mmetsp:Transcript_8125/g.12154  ORF Transcript_8125/g.12154 Transcript_8125/m.12154 type:complete len:228 (-) Transcript_8125:746-1429(-)